MFQFNTKFFGRKIVLWRIPGWKLPIFSILLTILGACSPTRFLPESRNNEMGDGSQLTMSQNEKDREGEIEESKSLLPPLNQFFVGYNESWFLENWGRSLTSGFDAAYSQKVMRDMKAGGAQVVRFWLFVNADGLVRAPEAPQIQGMSAQALNNLKNILDTASKNQIYLYLTLFDANTIPRPGTGDLADFFYNLFNNEYSEGDGFNVRVLGPMLDLLNQYQHVIYGIDLINEIRAVVDKGVWADRWNGPRDWMLRTRNFIKDKSPWMRITADADQDQFFLSGILSGLGFDFYDFHSYSPNGEIASLNAICDRARQDGLPIILGEFGQSQQFEDDDIQMQVTDNYLKQASQSCFSGALAWRFDSKELFLRFVRDDYSFRPAVQAIQRYSHPGPLPSGEVLLRCPTYFQAGQPASCSVETRGVSNMEWRVNNQAIPRCKNQNTCSWSSIAAGVYNVRVLGFKSKAQKWVRSSRVSVLVE